MDIEKKVDLYKLLEGILKFLLSSVLSFTLLFQSSIIIAYINRDPIEHVYYNNVANYRFNSNEFYKPIPFVVKKLTNLEKALREEEFSAQSIIVHDVQDNQNILAINPNSQTLIASLTKIISTLVIYREQPDLEKKITVRGVDEIGGSEIVLEEGSIFTTLDLLKLALINSNNQAIYALNDTEDTVSKMNALASSLRLENTKFSNPAGFDDDNNYSSAMDLIPLIKLFQNEPTLYEITQERFTYINNLANQEEIYIENTNDLLLLATPGIIGGKTGTTPLSGQNLVLFYKSPKDGKDYIIVILNSIERYEDSYKILENL